MARLIHNMRVGEASDVVRRAVRRGGGVRSPESAPTSDVRDETLIFVVDFFSRVFSIDFSFYDRDFRVQLACLRKLRGVMIVSRAETKKYNIQQIY